MMLGCQLACESIAGENPQNQPPTAAASRGAHHVPGEHVVPGRGGAGEAERDQHHEGDRRPEEQRHRHHRDAQRQHGRVGHQVDAVGIVELLGVERVLAVQHHPHRVGEEELHLRRVAAVERGHPAGRVDPDPAGHPERGEQEQPAHRQVLPPPGPATPPRRRRSPPAPRSAGTALCRLGTLRLGRRRGLGRFRGAGRCRARAGRRRGRPVCGSSPARRSRLPPPCAARAGRGTRQASQSAESTGATKTP